MYEAVANNLFVPGTVAQRTRSVSMSAANRVRYCVTVIKKSDGVLNLEINLEESDDRENWTLVETNGVTTEGYSEYTSGNYIASQFVRLRFDGGGLADAVVAAGIDTADL